MANPKDSIKSSEAQNIVKQNAGPNTNTSIEVDLMLIQSESLCLTPSEKCKSPGNQYMLTLGYVPR